MKLLLVATTALVCVTALAAADALPTRPTGSGYGAPSTNDEFLCNYGFKVHKNVFFSSSFYSSAWVRAATPIIGKGEMIDEITIEDGPAYSGIEVALYSSYRDKPAKPIVMVDDQSQTGCSRVSVPISPVTLARGKKYWVVESAVMSSYQGSESFVWLYDRKRTHGALEQSGYCNYYSGCSARHDAIHIGRWKPIKGGVPYARVGRSDRIFEPNHPVQSLATPGGSHSAVVLPIGSHGHQGNVPGHPP